MRVNGGKGGESARGRANGGGGANPARCPICEAGVGLGDTGVKVAGGKIHRCSTCAGYFLFPPEVVESSDSGWSHAREAKWEQDVKVAMDFAPRICSHLSALLRRPVTSVLEIGCGSGFMGVGFESAGCTYTGVDVDGDSIELARSKGLDAHCVAVEALTGSGLSGKRYDLVLSANVFEHVANPIAAFATARELCSGVLTIIVPNATGLYQRLRAVWPMRHLAQAILGNRRNIAYSIDGYWHNIAYTATTLEYLCKEVGLVVSRCETMSINDPLFGFVQRNTSPVYLLAAGVARLLRMDSELILTATPGD